MCGCTGGLTTFADGKWSKSWSESWSIGQSCAGRAAAARHLLDLMEHSADCEAAQRGSVSKAVKLRSDPRSEAKRHFLLQEKRQPSTRSVAKELLTADGNAARNKTHAELQKKVRANGARKAGGEATAGAAKAPSTAEGEEAAAARVVEAAANKENGTRGTRRRLLFVVALCRA